MLWRRREPGDDHELVTCDPCRSGSAAAIAALAVCGYDPRNGRCLMKLLAFIGGLAIVVAILAVLYFFGGFYNVAAMQEDPGIVKWALVKVRLASIGRHAKETPPVSLDDPAMVQAGARAFSERGCVRCHGAPGVEWSKFSEGLRPDPPELKDVVYEREPRELFWVIKNGINMTGMPSFALAVAPREVESSVTPAPNAKFRSKRLMPSPNQRSFPYASDQIRWPK
jgi:mono/diheme cytochrome c family protein